MPSASLYMLGPCMSGRSLAFRHRGDAPVKTPDRPNPRRINFIHTSPPGNHQQMDVNALVAYLEFREDELRTLYPQVRRGRCDHSPEANLREARRLRDAQRS